MEDTDPYREATALSDRFPNELFAGKQQSKRVAIIGGGLSGLSCAKRGPARKGLRDTISAPGCFCFDMPRPRGGKGSLGGVAGGPSFENEPDAPKVPRQASRG